MACAGLWALVALLVCTAANARSTPHTSGAAAYDMASRMHVHSGRAARSQWLQARSRLLAPGDDGGNETSTCNGNPFEGEACTGVFQYKVEFAAALPDGNLSITQTTDCFGKTVIDVGALGGMADGIVDMECTGVLRFSMKTVSSSPSGTNASLLQYRCAYDYTYTSTEETVDGEKKGETFQNCNTVDHVISITSSAGLEDADVTESDLEQTADALMDEVFSANPPSNPTLQAGASGSLGATGPLFAHPASPSEYDCKTNVTCNGEATTHADPCVGDWLEVEDCTVEGGGVSKTVCKGGWYPSPKSATCKGDLSWEFVFYGDEVSFLGDSSCKGTMTTSWDVKGGLDFWTALCLGKSSYSTAYESGVAPGPSANWQGEPSSVTRASAKIGVVTVT